MSATNVPQQPSSAPVLWITGLSGSGKTTIARALHQSLLAKGITAVLLDGDHLREVFGDQFGHSRDERLKASQCYARLCKMLCEQGITVICSTISLFHDTQTWNREHIAYYLEIYVKVPMEVLIERDSKNIYSRAREGTLNNVVGIDIPAEEPRHPDMVIENHGDITVVQAVQMIEGLCSNYMCAP